MKAISTLFLLILYLGSQETYFEKSKYLESAKPGEVINYYEKLNSRYIKINKAGVGDANHPIHEIIISKKGYKSYKEKSGELVYFVLNGIHSGEAGGIDASQILAREHIKKLAESSKYDNIILVIIPVYNVGGHTKYSPYNRVNQNGPLNMGFRGNARNYDLNRDFIKMDTKNMSVFAELFHNWQPQVFMDNHSTDGADYQYAMTYMINDVNIDPEPVRSYIQTKFLPSLEENMIKRKYPIKPYVSLVKYGDIKQGMKYYRLSPRFSTTYASLFNCISILVETHMLKPYKNRVLSNYEMMASVVDIASENESQINNVLEKNHRFMMEMKRYTIKWQLNKNKPEEIDFKSYEYSAPFNKYFNASLVKYDRSKPRTYKIPYYKDFDAIESISVPKAYIIPQQWHKIIQKLKDNKIKMEVLGKDMEFEVEQYRLSAVEFNERPFEGHVMIKNLETTIEKTRKKYRKGDILVKTEQRGKYYLLESLEPKAVDSFFRWGFFNTVLQQKEYFDPYIFVDKIEKIFEENPKLRADYENAVKNDANLKKNGYARLQYIYYRSAYYEKHSHLLYPISRLID